MAHVIVEATFETPLTDADLKAGGERLATCLELRNARWIRSYLSKDRRRRICELQGPDAESVREAYRSAGQPFDRVWIAGAVARIEDYPDWLERREKLRARLKTRD